MKESKPENIFVTPRQIGNFESFEELFDHFPPMLSGYQPSFYIKTEDKDILHDEKQREFFLVKMMYILMVKRLESSWYSFYSTVDKIRVHHQNALNKIKAFQAVKTDSTMDDEYEAELFDGEELRGRNGCVFDEATRMIAGEITSRLRYLNEVGLSYLTLDRQSRTLSGGEVERVSLTKALGSSLVNTLYVLDEPSIGLHPRDSLRLVKILQKLSRQNTVVVVEHDPEIIQGCDYLLDLGPKAGEAGGNIVYFGPFFQIPDRFADSLGKDQAYYGNYDD